MLHDLTLSLQFGKLQGADLHRAALPRHKVARWLRHALASDAEITVRIVDAEEGRALNRDYRHKDYATNAAAAGAALKGGGLGEALTRSFSGARADGGPVLPGGSYLVGERGPEVFRPASAGSIEPAGGGGISVTVNVQSGEASGLIRSDAQIAQALARAVSLGARRL